VKLNQEKNLVVPKNKPLTHSTGKERPPHLESQGPKTKFANYLNLLAKEFAPFGRSHSFYALEYCPQLAPAFGLRGSLRAKQGPPPQAARAKPPNPEW